MKNTEREHSLGYLVWKLSNAARAYLETQLGEISLSVAQMSTLCALHDESSHSIADLARELHLTPQNLSLVVSKLEGEGHLERHAHETSRRVQKLVLTARGGSTMQRAIGRAKRVDERMAENLSTTERTLLIKLLHKCLHAMRAGRAAMPSPAAPAKKSSVVSSRRKRG